MKIVYTFFFFIFGISPISSVNSFLSEYKFNSISAHDSGYINGIEYIFYEKDNYYSFIGEFFINIDYDCLVNVSYSVEHKKRYNKNVSSITLIKEGNGEYIVRYIIEKLLIVKNTSYWLLRFLPKKKMIRYTMLSNKSNLKLYDVITKSQGYYRFIPSGSGYKVVYFQESYLESGFLMRPYKTLAKDEAINFISDFKDYLNEVCQ